MASKFTLPRFSLFSLRTHVSLYLYLCIRSAVCFVSSRSALCWILRRRSFGTTSVMKPITHFATAWRDVFILSVVACRFVYTGVNVRFWKDFIILPDNVFLTYWNAIIVVLTVWFGFYIPYDLAFHRLSKSSAPSWMVSLEIACDVAFAVDIVLHFRTAYYRGVGLLEVSWKLIALRYIRSWFLVDLFGALQLERYTSSSRAHIVGMLRMSRLFRLGRLRQSINALRFSFIGSIVQLYTLIFLIGHWIACG
jgi:hypothetical protein